MLHTCVFPSLNWCDPDRQRLGKPGYSSKACRWEDPLQRACDRNAEGLLSGEEIYQDKTNWAELENIFLSHTPVANVAMSNRAVVPCSVQGRDMNPHLSCVQAPCCSDSDASAHAHSCTHSVTAWSGPKQKAKTRTIDRLQGCARLRSQASGSSRAPCPVLTDIWADRHRKNGDWEREGDGRTSRQRDGGRRVAWKA